jgi:S-adenosylmethionine-dependent methyltransferase
VASVSVVEPTFDERAEWFDAHYATTRGRVRLALVVERLEEILPPPPARILDAGGGTGAVAIPMAGRGHRVTLLEPSAGMRRVAHERLAAAGVDVDVVAGAIEDAPSLVPGPFDAVCCHAVLLYTDDPEEQLRRLRALVDAGGVLSLLEKNRDALAMRPGFAGDFDEARRVLDDPMAAGNLGIANRSRTVAAWRGLLATSGWRFDSWVGVRLFSDAADGALTPDAFEALLALEREAGRRDPYRSLSRLIHVAATAV